MEVQANQLKKYLEPASGYNIKIIPPGHLNNIIKLQLDKNLARLREEGYKLG